MLDCYSTTTSEGSESRSQSGSASESESRKKSGSTSEAESQSEAEQQLGAESQSDRPEAEPEPDSNSDHDSNGKGEDAPQSKTVVFNGSNQLPDVTLVATQSQEDDGDAGSDNSEGSDYNADEDSADASEDDSIALSNAKATEAAEPLIGVIQPELDEVGSEEDLDVNIPADYIPGIEDIENFSVLAPKEVIVKKSSIANAGDGLFLLEPAKKGESVALYSGAVIDDVDAEKSKSRYLLQVRTNVVLDATDPRHKEGRMINCARKSGKEANCRFQSDQKYHLCPASGIAYVHVYAMRDIDAEEELLVDYQDYYWGYTYWQGWDEDTSQKLVIRIKNVDGYKAPDGYWPLPWLNDDATGWWPYKCPKGGGWVHIKFDKKNIRFHGDKMYLWANKAGENTIEATAFQPHVDKETCETWTSIWKKPLKLTLSQAKTTFFNVVANKQKMDKTLITKEVEAWLQKFPTMTHDTLPADIKERWLAHKDKPKV